MCGPLNVKNTLSVTWCLRMSFLRRNSPPLSLRSGQVPPHYRGFMITLRHTALGRTPLDEWSAWRRDLYLTTHNTHRRLDTHADGGIRTRDSSKRAATDPTLTARSLAWAYVWSSEMNWTVLCLLLNTAQFKGNGGWSISHLRQTFWRFEPSSFPLP